MSDYTLAVSWSGKDALADSDSAKVISGSDFNTEFTTIRTAVNSKANIASPTLTGTPAAPTASASTSTTQIATTAFATTADNLKANLASPALTGTPTAPTAATSTNTTQVATTAMVQAAIDADVTTHAALRSASGTYGHAQIYTSGGDLYIVTT
jgi:hypothetical protein